MFQIPTVECLYAVFQFHFMPPSESMKFRNVGQFPHRSVGLGRVPANLAGKPDSLLHQFCRAGYRSLYSAPDIDVAIARFRRCAFQLLEIHMFHDVDRRIRHVFAPQKFPDGLSRAPKVQHADADAETLQHRVDFLVSRRSVQRPDRAFGQVFAQSFAIVLHAQAGKVHFPYHCRQHMAPFEIEIVVGPERLVGMTAM